MRTISLALLFGLLVQSVSIASTVTDGDVELSVELDRHTAQVAEPIEVTVTVSGPNGTVVGFPDWEDLLAEFLVRQVDQAENLPANESGTRRKSVAQLVVESFQAGDLSIPSIEISYRESSRVSSSRIIRSEPISFQVVSMLEDRIDPSDFRDIKPVIDVDVPQGRSNWSMWVTLAGLPMVALFVAVFVWSRRHPRELPAAQRALAEIDEIKSATELQQLDAASVYAELTDVIRSFLQQRFGFDSSACTTLLSGDAESADLRVGEQARQQLDRFVSVADQVRFAKRSISQQQLDQAIDQARDIVVTCDSIDLSQAEVV
ncbi:MAG: hypothetical protein HKN47_25845 [Pirellulaceae bacterium]|nr:hypothetical protein [Pirellulaceae bacterium]